MFVSLLNSVGNCLRGLSAGPLTGLPPSLASNLEPWQTQTIVLLRRWTHRSFPRQLSCVHKDEKQVTSSSEVLTKTTGIP